MTRYARLNFALMLASLLVAGVAFIDRGLWSSFAWLWVGVASVNSYGWLLGTHAKRVDLSSKEFR